jgi:citrate lyase beta subunit
MVMCEGRLVFRSISLLPCVVFGGCASEDDFVTGGSEMAVRINPVSSGFAGEDLRAVLSVRQLPDAIVVPKIEQPDDIHWLMSSTEQLLAARSSWSSSSSSNAGGLHRAPLALVTMCESAKALLDLR